MKKMFIFSVAISLTLVSSAFSAINDDLKKALKNHDCKMIEHFLAEGADITTIDAFGHNALHIATLENNGHLVAEILLCYETKLATFIDQQDYSFGSTALHFAFLVQSEQIIELLFAANANETIKDFYGFTPNVYWHDNEKTENISICRKPNGR